MVTEILFVLLVLGVGAQRLWELRKSARNEALLRKEGAVEHAPEQMTWMRLVHGGWLCCAIAEVLLLDRAFHGWLAAIAIVVFSAGQILRLTAMRALGWRWNVKILTLPQRPPVQRGIFNYVRHPNYLGVILEIAALPLVHTAYLTSAIFTVLNGLLLWRRIKAEEAALHGYDAAFADRPRLVPRWRA